MFKTLFTVTLVVVLTACGGPGSKKDSDTPSNPPAVDTTPHVKINTPVQTMFPGGAIYQFTVDASEVHTWSCNFGSINSETGIWTAPANTPQDSSGNTLEINITATLSHAGNTDTIHPTVINPSNIISGVNMKDITGTLADEIEKFQIDTHTTQYLTTGHTYQYSCDPSKANLLYHPNYIVTYKVEKSSDGTSTGMWALMYNFADANGRFTAGLEVAESGFYKVTATIYDSKYETLPIENYEYIHIN